MSCPSCGGSAHVLVANGLAECTEAVSVPTGAQPSGIHGPTEQLVSCGNRYQVPVAGAAAFCGCGMQAIARCTECGLDLCLDHTWRQAGAVLCTEHGRAARGRSQAAAKAAEEAALGRLQSLLEAVTQQKVERRADAVLTHRLAGAWSDSRVGDFDGLTPGQLSALRYGQTCPSHGTGCRLVNLIQRGRVFKKTWGAEFEMPVWTVPKYGLSINGAGRIVNHAKPGFAPNMIVLQTSLESLEIYRRVPGVSLEKLVTDLADRVERALTG